MTRNASAPATAFTGHQQRHNRRTSGVTLNIHNVKPPPPARYTEDSTDESPVPAAPRFGKTPSGASVVVNNLVKTASGIGASKYKKHAAPEEKEGLFNL